MPLLDSCCRCGSLRTGTIVSGALGIVIGIVTMILVLVTNVKFKTVILDFLPKEVLKIMLAVSLFMTAVISALLIFGAAKRNKFLMLPWVVLAFMLSIGILVTIIWAAVVSFIDGFALQGALILLFGLLGLGVYVYMWMVVYSYFQLLMEEGGRGPYGKPAYWR
ncbi:uncharacterized protein LOC134541127 [Bacillus rossius redtenbacheri]|uniref:uncharacterized protein LOC134541127 n=1 Tax=Bacillus rossius redtenbacheri TaxID=93214 RepID=UPI002FDDA052